MKKKQISLLTLILACIFTACTDKMGENPDLELISADEEITIEGGTLEVTDESGNTVSIEFPPGAVMDTVQVSLTLPELEKTVPIDEKQVRVFEIRPLDINLYEPAVITIQYNTAVSDLEKAALFRVRSEDWLTPLSDHVYSGDNKSLSAKTLFLGDFAEGKMTLAQLNAQFDLLVSSMDIQWNSISGKVQKGSDSYCDTRIHKAIWDEWREVIGGFITFFKQRYLIGYYNDLPDGQLTYEEEQDRLCEEVVSKAIGDVLKQCIPEDLCDRDYTHTISNMVLNVSLLGCEGTEAFNLLQQRFDQILIDCASYLTFHSDLDIESGGIVITTEGVVPVTLTKGDDRTATVEGMGSLKVSGKGSAGGACSSVVSGETQVSVYGSRSASFSYELTIILAQIAEMVTTCPGSPSFTTPLTGGESREVTLSTANGYSVTIEEEENGTTYVLDITLGNPYLDLPDSSY